MSKEGKADESMKAEEERQQKAEDARKAAEERRAEKKRTAEEARKAEEKKKADKVAFLERHFGSFNEELLGELDRQEKHLASIGAVYQKRADFARHRMYLAYFVVPLALGFGIVAMPYYLMERREYLWLPMGALLFGCLVVLFARTMTWLPSLQTLQKAVDALAHQQERLSAFRKVLSFDLRLNFEMSYAEKPDEARDFLNLKRRFLESFSERTQSILLPGVDLPPLDETPE